MAHIKADPTQGHVEGDKIWDRESNRLYILKNINGKLVWDVPRLDRKDGFWAAIGQVWNTDESEDIRSGNVTGEDNLKRHKEFMTMVARGYIIRDGEVYKSGRKLTGPLNKRAFYSTNYNSETANLLEILAEEQANIRKSNRKDGQYLVNYNKSKRYFTKLESLSKRYNIPIDVLLGLNIEEDLGAQLNTAGYTNHRFQETLEERTGAKTQPFNMRLPGSKDPNKLNDVTLKDGSVIPGSQYQKLYMPLPTLKKILYQFNSYNNDVLTYQKNNPESLNVQNHLKTKPIKKEDFLNMLGSEEDINKLKGVPNPNEEEIPINDIIGDVY